MAQGSLGHTKTVNKSKHFWKHGKRKGRIVDAIVMDREKAVKRLQPEMFPTVREAFNRRTPS